VEKTLPDAVAPSRGIRTIVVTPDDLDRYRDLLDQAFALRHRVFVEGRGWQALRRPDRLDIDRHDTSGAIHILALDGGGVFGYTRLVPGGYFMAATVDPARMGGVPADAVIYGLSRFCIEPERRQSDAFDAGTAVLLCAVGECVRRYRIDALTSETDPSLIFILKVLGVRTRTIGEAAPYAGRILVPILLHLDAAILADLPAKIAMWRRLGISPPFGPQVATEAVTSAAARS
jgi:acyl-homoserine lactone synthase